MLQKYVSYIENYSPVHIHFTFLLCSIDIENFLYFAYYIFCDCL